MTDSEYSALAMGILLGMGFGLSFRGAWEEVNFASAWLRPFLAVLLAAVFGAMFATVGLVLLLVVAVMVRVIF